MGTQMDFDRLTADELKAGTREAIRLPLARLVYLASLRDYNTGRYSHAGWAFELTEEGADRALREFHLEEFGQLVQHSVEELAEELQSYFESLQEPVEEVVSVWREVESFRALLPRECHLVDRGLFLSAVRAALSVLASRVRFPSPVPQSASPPPSPDL